MRRKIKFCMAGIALGAICFAGCGKEMTEQEDIALLAPMEAVVDVEPVLYRDLYTMTMREAELTPYTEELSFKTSGTVTNLYVEVGSEVKAGDLLAEQEEDGMASRASAALDKYLSEKKVYVDTWKRAKKKLATNLSKEEKEQQELAVKQAEERWNMQEPILWAAWEEARAKVGSSQIFAPCDGVITACLVEGTSVAAGQPVMAIADTSKLCIVVGSCLPPSEYRRYERVYAVINGKETEITYMEDLMENENTYTYYEAQEWNGASIGDYILVCMVSDMHEHVLSVPNRAVYKDSDGSYVYLYEDGARVRREVITGYKDSVYVEIVEGLQEGDKVYVKN